MKEFYNTKQKEIIYKIIKEQKKEFTPKDIYIKANNKVGLTTIYRFIDKLVKDNVLVKTINEDNITFYQYLEKCPEKNHFYLKCEDCGILIHIDCDCISELISHIFIKHKFILNKEHILINGKCDKCRKETKLC